MLVPYKSSFSDYSLFKSLFDDFYKPSPKLSTYYSNSYLKKLDNKYELGIEMPGVSKEDVKVEVSNGVLTISGKKTKEEGEYIFNYMDYGDFKYSFTLPKDAGEVTGEMKNGILILSIERIDNSKKVLIK